MKNNVQDAISELAALKDYWSLMADTDPEAFLLCVKNEIVQLRAQRELLIEALNDIVRYEREYETLCANCPECIDIGPGVSAMFSMAKIAKATIEVIVLWDNKKMEA